MLPGVGERRESPEIGEEVPGPRVVGLSADLHSLLDELRLRPLGRVVDDLHLASSLGRVARDLREPQELAESLADHPERVERLEAVGTLARRADAQAHLRRL